MVDMEDIARKVDEAMGSIPSVGRETLLRLLELPEDERAAAIGWLYEMKIAPHTIELLIDLFDDPIMLRFLIRELRIAGFDPRRFTEGAA